MDETIGKLRIVDAARFNSLRTEQTRLQECTVGTREGVLKTFRIGLLAWTKAANTYSGSMGWRAPKVDHSDDYR